MPSIREGPGNKLDLESLADEWDGELDLRGRWREKAGSFLHPNTPAGEDINCCVLNNHILIPLLVRMAVVDGKPLPSIHDLHAQVGHALTKNNRPPQPEDFEHLMGTTWRIRFMLGFVKMKARRKEVSQVSRHISD